MKLCDVLPFVLLAITACPALYSQSPDEAPPGDASQYPSANCPDSMTDYGAGCQSSQEQYQGQYPSQYQGQYPGQYQGQYQGQYYGQQLGQQPLQQQMQFPESNSPSLSYPGLTNPNINGSENSPFRRQYPQRLEPREPRLPAPSEFQRFVYATTGQMLPIYGANLFYSVPSTFSPNDLAPVTPDYVIGPDDQLRIRIWGPINYSDNLRVDRSGNIYLPQVGAIHVAGLQFAALDQHLREAVGRIFRNFDLSVDIGQIRAIQVYVTGQARRPGAYTVSSLSTLVNALFASGGPSPQGSLRHILVKRNGVTVTDFDLYALLIHGDKSHDIRLLPDDVLFIPPAGPQVAIAGTVRNPAIYELRGDETIGDLIEMAGSTSAMASNTRISLERVEEHQLRQAMQFPFDKAGLAFPIADGDIVQVYPILPAYQKTVTLRGNVANPGRFAWTDGMHLSDLIPDRDSLQSRDYWWKRSRLGLPVPTFEPVQRANTNTSRTTEGGLHGSIASRVEATSEEDTDNDTSGNRKRSESLKRNTVVLTTPEINWDYAVIERTDPKTLKTSLIPFDLGKLVIDHDASQNRALRPGDVVTIFSQDDIRVPLAQQSKYVDLEGEFVHAGIYSVEPGETLREMVRRAGGFTDKAYLYGSEFTRESTRKLQQQRMDEYVQTVRMEAQRGTQALALSGASGGGNSGEVAASQTASQELVARLSQIKATGRIVLEFHPDSSKLDQVPEISLENGDKFIVPAAPSTINVVGAVYDQNSFLYQPGRSVEHYLKLAGGPNRNADRHYVFVIRADGSVVSRAAERNFGLWSSSFDRLILFPGDTIVMPDKTLRPTALRGVMDWTQVFSQLALGAAAINVL
jgi:protein involved in polysaccharide export with SLBB domain